MMAPVLLLGATDLESGAPGVSLCDINGSEEMVEHRQGHTK